MFLGVPKRFLPLRSLVAHLSEKLDVPVIHSLKQSAGLF